MGGVFPAAQAGYAATSCDPSTGWGRLGQFLILELRILTPKSSRAAGFSPCPPGQVPPSDLECRGTQVPGTGRAWRHDEPKNSATLDELRCSGPRHSSPYAGRPVQ